MWQSTALRLAADHPAAAGHFPGNPIIPGALLLDAVVAAVAAAAGAPTMVIRTAKFLRPVRPGAGLLLRWQAANPGAIRFECRLTESDDLAAAGTLEPGPPPR